MTAAGADDIVIGRVRLALPAGSPVHVRQQSARSRLLRASSWPTAPGEIVFVRRLQVRTRWGELERSVVGSVRDAIERAHASGEGVMRFAGEEALRVALLVDLLDRVAPGCWWWTISSWKPVLSLPKATALARVLADEPLRLGSLTAGLEARGRLRELFAALDERSADTVLRALWSAAVAPVSSSAAGGGIALLPAPVVSMLRHRWSAALADCPAHDRRVRLAAAIAAVEVRPALLSDGPESPSMMALAALLVEQPSSRSSAKPAPPVQGPCSDGSSMPSARQLPEAGTVPGPAEAAPGLAATAATSMPANREPVPVDARSDPPSARPVRREDGSEQAEVENPTVEQRHPIKARPEPPWPSISVDRGSQSPAEQTFADELTTAYASTFYLVNALSRPELAPLAAPALDEPGGAWALLVAWARGLDLAPADPLPTWLAQTAATLAGEKDAAAAASRFASVHASTLERLHAVAIGCYGAELWQPRLLAVPGLVRFTRTHVDVTMSLDRVRLEVRLAGLDLNPGWVPWLGRVISLHYENEVPACHVQ